MRIVGHNTEIPYMLFVVIDVQYYTWNLNFELNLGIIHIV